MSGRFNSLEKEILTVMANRVIARWTDIKEDISEDHKKLYSGTGFDVVLSRSLKRLVERNMLWKRQNSNKSRSQYILSPKGSVFARRIRTGLNVMDTYRDSVLAFSSILQRLRNDTIITINSDRVVDYFTHFKELINMIDVETFLEKLWVNEQVICTIEDPLGLSDFTDENVDFYKDV
jgi:hypothetical protein